MPSGSGLDSPYVDIAGSALLQGASLGAGMYMALTVAMSIPGLNVFIAAAALAYGIYSFFSGRSKYKKNRKNMRKARNDMVLKLIDQRKFAGERHEANKYNYRAEMSAKNRDPESTISEGFVNAEQKRYTREDNAWAHLQKVMPEQMTDNFYQGGVASASANANSVYGYGQQYMQGNQEMYNLFNPPNYSGGGSPATPGSFTGGGGTGWEQKYYSYA